MVKKVAIFILVCLILNTICFAYYNPAHGSDLNLYRLEPGTVGVNAVEGLGIIYADKNGFANMDKPLIDSDYILVMGSSQTKADQVMNKDRYSSKLNQYLGYEDELGVYNLGFNGGMFTDIVKNFKQLLNEFPESEYIIVEVADSQLAVDDKSYENAMKQIEPEKAIYGEKLNEHSIMGKVRRAIKLYCPLLLLYVNQFNQWKNMADKNDSVNSETKDIEEITGKKNKREKYEAMLHMMIEQYSGQIIVLYHNGFKLDENDKYIVRETETKKAFFEACKKNNIDVVDMTYIWEEYFEKENVIPYGFNNTSPGEGHLNKKGHEIIAKEIYKYFGGISEK